ncbi:MAG: methyltransferase domain-containing protein [Alphaproteobacteria bacterium]|nr:methyltransferase domain-containing protein [Alphaproteobacteria bacterium]
MKNAEWYYSVQLHDGSVAKGFYEDGLTLLPRLMQRRVDLTGMRCLDIGPCDGLLPIVAKKGGAALVAVADYDDRAFDRLHYLQAIHRCQLELNVVGRAHNAKDLLRKYRAGFDYINLSGVLYHVTSPIDVLAAARTLLRPNGLMIVSTIGLIAPDRYVIEFNNNGRLQHEHTTFWYISLPLLDYMLRLLCLRPIDVAAWGTDGHRNVSVLCRATERPIARADDPWMDYCAAHSWELGDFHRSCAAAPLPQSRIALREGDDREVVSLYDHILATGPLAEARSPRDGHLLMLDDTE